MNDEASTGRTRLPGIDPIAYAHPLDRAALVTLQKVPGLDWVIKRFLTTIGERRLRLLFLASAVRVGESQFPRVHALLEEACEILDLERRPELFVSQQLALNAAAMGVDDPFIVINSPLLEVMDDDELACVIAHEVGHIACGHALYTTMLTLLVRMWHFFIGVPGGIYAVIAINLALLEWSRKAELTADRAGALVVPNPETSYRVNMKLAGGPRIDEMSLEAIVEQGMDYDAHGDLIDGALKLALTASQTHPFPVPRIAELRRWVESGEYAAILSGEYPVRGSRDGDAWLDSVKSVSGEYRESVERSGDPFLETLRDLGAGATATGADALELIRRALERDGRGQGGDT